jgi:hypothetical protein
MENEREDGYFYLGQYCDFLLAKTIEKSNATAAAAAALGECGKSSSSSKSKSKSGGSGGATTGFFTEDASLYLIKSLENYTKSLQFGSSYIFRSLPRLLTLWFEYTESLMTVGVGSSQYAGAGSQFSPESASGSSLSRKGSRGASVQALGAGGRRKQDSASSGANATVEEKALQQMAIVMRRALKRVQSYQWYCTPYTLHYAH